ncbi:MAG: GH3 auxin-responsive promoter family protein, partial [Chloroflexota bacterium]|nr:GH3 auxin-responsive promoter family protein [Chloroflexota bacterium]
MSGLSYRAFKAGLDLTQGPRYRGMMRAARDPRGSQEAALRRILSANADTEFGREHGFARVSGLREYRQAVPVCTYEDLREAIERQELTGDRCLTQEQPVYYHRTSGTVGAPKDIPVTPSGLAQMKRDQRLSAYVWARHTGVLESKVLGIGGAAVEGRMAGGTPFGSASGLLYRSQSRLVRSRYVLPAEVSEIEDYDLRYLTIAVYGLSEGAVTGAATANPSTFLRLLAVVHDNADTVFDAIATGRLPESPPGLSLKARPERARALSRWLEAAGRLT